MSTPEERAEARTTQTQKLTWTRTCAGVYASTDGQHKVRKSGSGNWHWLISDGRGGWDWAQTFAYKSEAQAAASMPRHSASATGKS